MFWTKFFLVMLSCSALDVAIEELPEEGTLLTLNLSPAVAAMQCAISTGVLREDHVAVQNVYRMCLQLFKQASLFCP
jgi:hypothetical protein